MQDNLIIMGINSPKEHQAVITHLIHGLAELYLKDKTSLFPYPKTMIDEGQTSPAPDMILYDHHKEKTMVIIEVSHTAGAKKDSFKVQTLVRDYDVPEGFVYDYKKCQWYKIVLNSEQEVNNSFSSLLNTDLALFLRK